MLQLMMYVLDKNVWILKRIVLVLYWCEALDEGFRHLPQPNFCIVDYCLLDPSKFETVGVKINAQASWIKDFCLIFMS